jgi:hypothetical protein
MKVVTSVTIFKDAVGLRLHATYTELDEKGSVISDNNHVDRVLTQKEMLKHSDSLFVFAEGII